MSSLKVPTAHSDQRGYHVCRENRVWKAHARRKPSFFQECRHLRFVKLAHDLPRTCAKLCRKSDGDLEQIKFLLGHSSILTTERHLGSEQEISVAVNDRLGL